MRFSIIIPVFNVEKELRRCLDSVLNQSFKDFEVIVVDDGSTDGSGYICDEYEKIDKRIKVVHQQNGGLASARNTGLDIAAGEYFVFLDSDDYIENDFCKRLENTIMICDSDVIAIKMVFENGNRKRDTQIKDILSNYSYNNRDFLISVIRNSDFYAEACANVYKATFWRNNHFSFMIIYHEDLELTLKVFLAAKTIAYCPEAKYHAVARNGSIMHDETKSINRYNDFLYVAGEWLEIAKKLNDKMLSNAIRGAACRTFVYSCALNHIYKPNYDLISKRDILFFSMNIKDVLKGVLFIVSPRFYSFLWRLKYK